MVTLMGLNHHLVAQELNPLTKTRSTFPAFTQGADSSHVWSKGKSNIKNAPMKCDQPLLIVLAALAFANCSTVSVRTEHDPRTNLAKYRTYAWAPRPKSGIQPGPGVRAQIESLIDQGLAAKGYTKSAHPDFYIVYHITRSEQVQVSQYTDWGMVEDSVTAVVAVITRSGQTIRSPLRE